MNPSHPVSHRRRWLKLSARIARLLASGPRRTDALVRDSYDRISAGYDAAWTDHMRDLSLRMLDRLAPRSGARCLDLTCGTGFVTSQLAVRTGRLTVGVDSSPGMLTVARQAHADRCEFICVDAENYLRGQPAGQFDIVTCAWGLGYARPRHMLRRIVRVLRPGGRVGIIDNSLLSLASVLWASLKTFAELPETLVHAMNVRFLPHSSVLAFLMRMAGLGVERRWDGAKSYTVRDGATAIERLTATGAAAGFEFAVDPTRRQEVFARFAEILERDSREKPDVRITHRYVAAIGVRT